MRACVLCMCLYDGWSISKLWHVECNDWVRSNFLDSSANNNMKTRARRKIQLERNDALFCVDNFSMFFKLFSYCCSEHSNDGDYWKSTTVTKYFNATAIKLDSFLSLSRSAVCCSWHLPSFFLFLFLFVVKIKTSLQTVWFFSFSPIVWYRCDFNGISP